jgi:hypothetical protein
MNHALRGARSKELSNDDELMFSISLELGSGASITEHLTAKFAGADLQSSERKLKARSG